MWNLSYLAYNQDLTKYNQLEVYDLYSFKPRLVKQRRNYNPICFDAILKTKKDEEPSHLRTYGISL